MALELVSARDAGRADQIRQDVEELAASGLAPTPLVDGNDLIEAGMHPGPRFKLILDAVYDAQLEGRVTGQTAALALARRIASDDG